MELLTRCLTWLTPLKIDHTIGHVSFLENIHYRHPLFACEGEVWDICMRSKLRLDLGDLSHWLYRDQSRYAPSQWVMSLHCNDVSHWLGAYLDLIPDYVITGTVFSLYISSEEGASDTINTSVGTEQTADSLGFSIVQAAQSQTDGARGSPTKLPQSPNRASCSQRQVSG